MQKISEEAFAAMPKVKNGKKHPVSIAISELQVGEILQIQAADWKWKTKTPSIFVQREKRRTRKRFEFYKMTSERGWIVKRIS